MRDRQLALGVTLRDNARFDNFLPGFNGEIIDQLQALAGGSPGSQVFLWSGPGQGKTHLLQAACHAAMGHGRSAIYLPLEQSASLHPTLLKGLEATQLVCLDNLEDIAGQADWEEALFHFYNAHRSAGGCLLMSAQRAPAQLGISLPDLRSRLEWGPVYKLHGLDDSQRLEALQLRASRRGFDLPDDTGRFLMRRVPRDMPALFNLLDRLDEASLSAQRKLTIPFVKTVL